VAQKLKVKGHVTRLTGPNNGVRGSGKAAIVTMYIISMSMVDHSGTLICYTQ